MVCTHSPSPPFTPNWNAVAASAGIDQSLNPVQRRIRNFFARAATRIHRTAGLQFKQRFVISRRALALVKDRSIAMQPEHLQRAQYVVRSTRYAARCIEVFHAHQPGSAMMFCGQITADSGDE
jgi:hypothetical protein